MPKRKPMLKIVKFQHISLLKHSQKRNHEEHPYCSKTEKKNVNCISSTSEVYSNDFQIQTDEYGCYNNEPVVELVTYDDGATIIFDETAHQADTLGSRQKKPATYDDGPTITFDETTHQADTLASKLSKWATSCNIQHTHLSKLLKILAEEDIQHLPRDSRTLLSTPLLTEKSHIKPLDNGQYLHFGVENYLHKMLDSFKENVSAPISALHLSFNIDGTPISISGSTSFWMISGCVHNLIDIIQPKAFVVGIFKAFGKPDSYNNFLEVFVNEMENVLKSGILHNLKYYEIKFHSCVCDAPAIASIKQIKSHGGYYCCSKCFTKGISIKTKKGKVIVYPEIKAPLRSDVNFRNRKTINGEHDNDHHKSNHSILERLPIDMITQFPLDKMHLVDEGVCKRLIQIWLGKPGPQKLRSEKVQMLNKRLELCYFYSCSEFQRKTRTLHFANYLKASELRVFLLYTGPVVLKNILCKSTYKHFLYLSLAIRILTSPIYYRGYNEFAEDLLIYFVKHFPVLYGLSNVTYNVHGLIHIAKDAYNLGPLDENSCYKFESYIKIIKKMLHCSLRPLEQCYNRVYEINEANNVANSVSQNGPPILSKNMFGTDKYKICAFHNFKINTTTLNDNCIMLRDGHVILRVKYFEKNSSKISIFGQKLVNVEALNKEPNGLTEFFMVIGKFDEHVLKYQIKDLKLEVLCKMCCFPYDNNRFFLSPLNHTLADI